MADPQNLQSEFLLIARSLFQRLRRPMSPQELVEEAFASHLFSDNVAGRTPHQTMKSKLAVHVRRFGAESIFVRTSPGRFYLRSLLAAGDRVYDAPPHQRPASREQVLVFPTSWLDRFGRFQGISRKHKTFLRRLINDDVCRVLNRHEAELSDSWKQIVTYILVTRGRRVLSFKRGQYTRAEEFLRGARCVGFGGHVSHEDLSSLFAQGEASILQAARRELREELWLPSADRKRLDQGQGLKVVGILNDDSSANGRRHLGVILQYTVSRSAAWSIPRPNEKSITEVAWMDPAASPYELLSFEYWSQLCLMHFIPDPTSNLSAFMLSKHVALRPPAVLVIVGPIGSGKSATTAYLRSRWGYDEVNAGRVLARLLGWNSVTEEDRAAFQVVAWEFISSKDGPARLAKALSEAIAACTSKRVLVEGLRQKATLAALRTLLSPRRVGVVFVQTPFHIAFRFYRARASASRSVHDFLRVRDAPVEQEVNGFIKDANAVLYNWTGLGQYRRAVDALFSTLGVRRVSH